jgi:hypothetical protein
MSAAEYAPTKCQVHTETTEAPRLRTPGLFFCLSLLTASSAPALLGATVAQAQPAPEPVAPPPPAIVDAPVVTGPAAPQPEVQAIAPYAQPAIAEPAPLEKPLPPPADVKKLEAVESPSLLSPVLKVGLGLRTGLNLDVNNSSDNVQLSLYDGVVPTSPVMVRPYFSAQLTKHVGLVGNFQFGTAASLGAAALLDAIVQVKIVDEFQIWAGQHIPANDRLNFQGPFFNNGWNFEAPNTQQFPWDNGARDRGFTFWGLIAGGFLKYHLSMVDLQPGANIKNASFAGRVTFNFLDPENYYYTSGTYYGAQDTLALGGVIRGQKGTGLTDGMTRMATDNDFLGGAVDLLAEKRYSSGVYTLQAQYMNMNGTGSGYVVNQGTVDTGAGVTGFHPGQSFFGEVSWLSPTKVGIGQLQPNFHVGWGKNGNTAARGANGGDEVVSMFYDVGIGYIIDGFNHRYYLNYRRMNHDTLGKGDSIQLGAQLQI